MANKVREHIEALARKRNLLNTQIMEESDAERRNRIDSELRAIE